MAPGSNIILPGASNSSGSDGSGPNVNLILDANELIQEFMRRRNLDPSDLQSFLTGLDTVRGSIRRTKTRIKKKTTSGGIQADSAGAPEGLAGFEDEDSDDPVLLDDKTPINDMNDIKTLLNTIQNSGGETNIEVTGIQGMEDGEISITWKVRDFLTIQGFRFEVKGFGLSIILSKFVDNIMYSP